MMLHLANENNITCLQVLTAPSMCDEVNGLGRSSYKDHLFEMGSID